MKVIINYIKEHFLHGFKTYQLIFKIVEMIKIMKNRNIFAIKEVNQKNKFVDKKNILTQKKYYVLNVFYSKSRGNKK